MRFSVIASVSITACACVGFAADPFQEHGIYIGGSGSSPQAAALERMPAEQAKAKKTAATAASQALYESKNQLASEGVDARVVGFLNQRIKDGSADAAFDLGVRYLKGQGVAANTNEAARFFKLAAERGNLEAAKWISSNAPVTLSKSTNDLASPTPP